MKPQVGSESIRSKKVLLIFPGGAERKPRIPFSVIVLASYIRKHGFSPDILDTRIKDYKKINYSNYLAVGISSKTGEQLKWAVKIAKYIRKKSKVPIIWGGPHVSAYPIQTCKSKLADIVACSEGEESLLEILRTLEKNPENPNFQDIRGIVYKKNDKIIMNKERPFIDMNKLELPAYDLVDLNDYQDSLNYLTIETSRGCPHRCSFCYVHEFHRRRWRIKSIDKIINEINRLIDIYNIKSFFICDDNFFADKKRVIDFSKRIVSLKKGIRFFTQGRADYWADFEEEELNVLRKAGFEFIAIGAESGSQRVLDIINKDITVEDILKATKNCVRHNIRPVLSFIIGLPGEKKEDLIKTLDLYIILKKMSNKIEINGIYLFTPYPGTPIYKEAVKSGYKPKNSLEEWADWTFSHASNLVWLKPKQRRYLNTISKIALFFFIIQRLNYYGAKFRKRKLGFFKNILFSIASRTLKIDADFRWKKRFFSFAPEWFLFGYIINKFKIA